MAHYVEINFGIAIAATRTTFWTFAGLLVALGLEWVPAALPVGKSKSEETTSSTAKPEHPHHASADVPAARAVVAHRR